MINNVSFSLFKLPIFIAIHFLCCVIDLIDGKLIKIVSTFVYRIIIVIVIIVTNNAVAVNNKMILL